MASNGDNEDPPQDSDGESQATSLWTQADLLEEYSFSEIDSDSNDTANQSEGGLESQQGASQSPATVVCELYNQQRCTDGKKCSKLHVCKYSLQGNCRYGSNCHLKHLNNSGTDSSGDESHRGRRRRRKKKKKKRTRDRRRSSSEEDEADDGRPHRWQINNGKDWKDIAKGYVIEAQFSQPNVKGITLYNTKYGAIAIDFKKMKVRNKNLRVRRWSSSQPGKQTEWVWYYSGNHDWVEYGKKDSSGKAASVNSSAIEMAFQANSAGSFTFNIDTTRYQIHFGEMHQENMASGQKKKVVRRPRFKVPQERVSNLGQQIQNMAVSAPTWKFEGNSGKWYIFRHRKRTDTECSVDSAKIEAHYVRNPQGSMNFTVSGQHYTLSFKDMTQTNLSTNKVRRVRRDLQ
ncbi:hypothetical protein JZ751_008825 [Albula glossodonta]|uniref:Uncharacterized protein n=1 Tax=Albula glossodonta TaxID=121402 RepID=A0A8T2P2X7_9TELE|nr:hypothetical protein JZ751_008825 [Albula glossodonta]